MKENKSDRELVFERLFDAPRELVYKVWTDPEHVVRWWGPNGFTNTNHGMDVSPGGVWRFTMHGPDGRDYKNKIIFLEVIEPERLVYQHSDDGETEPVNFHVTVTFAAVENKTLLTMCMVFDSKEALERVAREYGAIEGAHQNLARMEAYVTKPGLMISNELPFVITRQLDAPRDLVFKVFSEASHLAHWWGPKDFKINIKKFDFQPGGTFHYAMVAENGFTMWAKFTYKDIKAPEKIVFVNAFADEEGNLVPPPFPDPWPTEIFYIFTLEESGSKTLLTIKSEPIHATDQERQTFINGFSSMQEGFGGTLDQLSAYLATL